MTIYNHIAIKETLVAIDISKNHHDLFIQVPGKKPYRMKITNERVDHDRLIDHLNSLPQPIHVGFEATGDYHRALVWRLLTAEFNVHLISSVSLARTREAIHNGWDKNDPKDAQTMLYMLAAGNVQRYQDPLLTGINDWQELSKTHDAISRSKTEVLHRLQTHHFPLYFPEIDRFRHNSRADSFFRFLYEFPTPTSILVLSRQDFIDTAWALIGRKVNKSQLLSDIYDTARDSTGLPIDNDSASFSMYRLVIDQMRQLIRYRDEIEAQASACLEGHPDFVRLQQLPGIGPIHALTILAEAGDLRRFEHHKQFLKYCGFDLATHQSGIFRGQTRLSKYGNARLRRTFWLAGQVAVRQRENNFRDKYNRYISKDRDNKDLRRKALTAVAVKMARVAHALIKHETDYRPFYGVR